MTTSANTPLPEILPFWVQSLTVANRSEATIKSYLLAAHQLTDWLKNHEGSLEVTEITKRDIEGFLTSVLAERASATARQRYASLKQLFRWLVEEGEIEIDPMARIKPPRMEQRQVNHLPIDVVKALLDSCAGKDFIDRRDHAIILTFLDTGLRLGEMAGLLVSDVDLDERPIVIEVMGKGRKERLVTLGSSASLSMSRYLMARRKHPHSDQVWLWIGEKGRLGYSGFEQMLARRSARLGFDRIHPHQLRHTFAHLWMSSGGSETDLMTIGGWSTRTMLDRYGASGRTERAIRSHREHSPGDRF